MGGGQDKQVLLSRRQLLRWLALGTVGASLPAGRTRAQQPASRVVLVVDGRAWRGPGTGDGDLDRARIGDMLRRGLEELAGGLPLDRALESLGLAGGGRQRRVAMKVNCVNARLPTHPAVALELAGLIAGGQPGQTRVDIFDRFRHELEAAGYPGAVSEAVAVRASDDPDLGYAADWLELSDGAVRPARLVAEQASDIVSLAVLKNHSMAGVTLSLKNHFGSVSDPQALHGAGRDCSPGIAELCASEPFRSRSRLWVIDALFGTCAGGLAGEPEFAPCALVLSRDPVAADTVGKLLIDQERARRGLEPTRAQHLSDAAARGLGQDDLERIELREIVLSPPRPLPSAGSCQGCSSSGRPGAVLLGGALLAAGASLPGKRRA